MWIISNSEEIKDIIGVFKLRFYENVNLTFFLTRVERNFKQVSMRLPLYLSDRLAANISDIVFFIMLAKHRNKIAVPAVIYSFNPGSELNSLTAPHRTLFSPPHFPE